MTCNQKIIVRIYKEALNKESAIREDLSLTANQSVLVRALDSNSSLSASKKSSSNTYRIIGVSIFFTDFCYIRPAELVKVKRLYISNASAVSTVNSMASGWLRPVGGLENPQESNIS